MNINPIAITIFLYLIGMSIIKNEYVLAAVFAVVFILYLASFPLFKKLAVKKIRALIPRDDAKFFIDINKAPLYIIKELPGITETEAKKAIWYRRKHGGFKSVEEFAENIKINPIYLQRVFDIVYVTVKKLKA